MRKQAAIQTAMAYSYSLGIPHYATGITEANWKVTAVAPKVRAGRTVYKIFPSSLDSGMIQDSCGDWVPAV